MSMDFDDLDDGGASSAEEFEYDLDDWKTVSLDEAGEAVVGELEAILENVGKYDARVYLIREDGEKVMLFGKANINVQVDSSEVEEGDMIGIRNNGETYENDYGEFAQFDVKFQKSE